jgi:hypothetical protein
MRRAGSLLGTALLALLVATPAWAGTWSKTVSASMSAASATLGAPGSVHCTSNVGTFVPITFTWALPSALSGKPTGPLSYTVERRANSGAWSTLATGLTSATYSDNPSALLALGTTWQYRVTAVYGSWTSPVSASVSGTYTTVALVTVLSSCSP